MSRKEPILIVGADGMIGRALAAHFIAAGENVKGTSRAAAPDTIPLDLARDAYHWTPPPASVAFLCAAVTSQEQCRRQPAASRAVNVEGTVVVAEKLVRQGTRVIFLSTNLVLSGLHAHQAADEPYTPETEYARQKAEAETRLLNLPGTCAVRFTKVLGRGTRLLVQWREVLLAGQVIRPFADMSMAPVTLEFAVKSLAATAAGGTEGVVQISAAEDVTYAAAACFVADRLGAPQTLVEPVKVAESGIVIEHVPRHTTLDTGRLRNELGLAPPCVWDAIEYGMQT